MEFVPSVNISALYLSLTALLALLLAWRVSKFRLGNRVALGDDGGRPMQAAIRAHANLMEWGPLTLLLLLVAELQGFSILFVHAAGSAFFLSRVAHAYGFSKTHGGSHPGRTLGALVNWLVLVVLAGAIFLAATGAL